MTRAFLLGVLAGAAGVLLGTWGGLILMAAADADLAEGDE